MLAVLVVALLGQAPFADAIQKFDELDRKSPPAPNQILFIGSSSFTKWTDVGTYFPDRKILNRAFGGSTLVDVIRYADRIIFPYTPKQIVIYCGENDLAGDAKLSPYAAAGRFGELLTKIRSRLPQTPVVYVSMKPSPSRWNLREKFAVANRSIARQLQRDGHGTFVDVWPVMLGADGKPKPEIFLADKLHMNASGYRLWKQVLDPVLAR